MVLFVNKFLDSSRLKRFNQIVKVSDSLDEVLALVCVDDQKTLRHCFHGLHTGEWKIWVPSGMSGL